MTRFGGCGKYGETFLTYFEFTREHVAWEDVLAKVPFSERCPRVDTEPGKADEYVGNCFALMPLLPNRPTMPKRKAPPEVLGYYFKPIEEPIWDWEHAFM